MFKWHIENRLSDEKFLIIDEISMASSGLKTSVCSKMEEIVIMMLEKAFTGVWNTHGTCRYVIYSNIQK